LSEKSRLSEKKHNPSPTSKKKSCALSLWSKENKARCFLKQREKNRTNTHSSRANLSSNRSRRVRAHSNAREFRSFFFKFFLVFVLCRRIEVEASDALGRRFLDKAIALRGENKKNKPFFGFIKRKTQVLAAAAVVVVTSLDKRERDPRDPIFVF
jgi:uncharacterized protein YggL (DUF469 family)